MDVKFISKVDDCFFLDMKNSSFVCVKNMLDILLGYSFR